MEHPLVIASVFHGGIIAGVFSSLGAEVSLHVACVQTLGLIASSCSEKKSSDSGGLFRFIA